MYFVLTGWAVSVTKLCRPVVLCCWFSPFEVLFPPLSFLPAPSRCFSGFPPTPAVTIRRMHTNSEPKKTQIFHLRLMKHTPPHQIGEGIVESAKGNTGGRHSRKGTRHLQQQQQKQERRRKSEEQHKKSENKNKNAKGEVPANCATGCAPLNNVECVSVRACA